MANYTTPGVYFQENDFSEYAPSINSSVAAVIGYASKGEVGKAKLITSAKQLIDTFGRPDMSTLGEHVIMGAMEILRKTKSLYFVRTSNGTDTTADCSAVVGICPVIQVEGVGVAGDYILRVSSVKDKSGNELLSDAVDCPFNTTTTSTHEFCTNLKTAVSNRTTSRSPFSMVTSGTTLTEAWLVGNRSGEYASVSASLVSGTSWDIASGVANGLGDMLNGTATIDATGVTASGGVFAATVGHMAVSSFSPGAGWNTSSLPGSVEVGLKFMIEHAATSKSDISVLSDGNTVETFATDFADTTGGNFVTTLLTNSTLTTKSSYVIADWDTNADANFNETVNFWDNFCKTTQPLKSHGITPAGTVVNRFAKLVNDTYDFTGGTNGDSGTIATNYTGALHQASKTGIYAIDDDSLNVSMACIPGVTDETVQNDLVTLAETSKNFIAVLSTPEGLKPQEAADWHNGLRSTRSASINSSYAAIYYPWLQVFNGYTGITNFVSPDVYAISTMANTDAAADPWFAPAGVVRGRLTKPLDVQYILNAGDRNTLYSAGNVINPIAKFNPDGIVIYGQRTAQRTPSSLDRVNVRRMMILLRKMILAATQTFVFEPNDPMTWGRVVGAINPLLNDITRRRGIVNFKVICDSSTNTPARIDRNELWCQVRIKPTKTAEIIVFEVNLTSQSTSV
tara:strand:- start:192 stop:2234 length:2043 start_codon:yes stop_codon:yes gene_type:complete